MKPIFSASLFVLGGAVAGIASAYGAAQMLGISAIASGSPWQVHNVAAAAAVHPYAVANYLLDGRLPPSGGQFVELTAAGDEGGNPLSSTCDYLLTLRAGKQPAWWSVSVLGGNSADNATVMSQSTVTEPDGSIRLIASRHPQPGNWIAAPAAGRYSLLYTASVRASGTVAAVPVFSLAKGRC